MEHLWNNKLKALKIIVRPELKLRTFNSARLKAGLYSRIYFILAERRPAPALAKRGLLIVGGFIPPTNELFQRFQTHRFCHIFHNNY